ncbi:hypothetical protein N8083_01595 [Candidatus Pacebacteria bacterium]|nr:hypothetical protein [Candidatus Paceibacterota bacterium]
MKVTIIGHNSCGKSTLAKKIAEKFSIPHLELDRLWFKHGGNKTPRSQTKERDIVRVAIHKDVNEFLAKHESWVSDGFYGQEQPTISDLADVIVFIDIPIWQRQWNHLKRTFKREGRHPELSIWNELYFTIDMIRRTRERKPQIRAFCEKFNEKLTHLTSHQEAEDYFDSLEK